MIRRKPLYVPAARPACPSEAVAPFVSASRLYDWLGVARTVHPPTAELSTFAFASLSSVAVARPSTSTTNTSTLCTKSVRNGASLSFTTTVPLVVRLGSVESDEHAAAIAASTMEAAVHAKVRRSCIALLLMRGWMVAQQADTAAAASVPIRSQSLCLGSVIRVTAVGPDPGPSRRCLRVGACRDIGSLRAAPRRTHRFL